jgi:hypothetical protein
MLSELFCPKLFCLNAVPPKPSVLKIVDDLDCAIFPVLLGSLALRCRINGYQSLSHCEIDHDKAGPEIPLDQDVISFLGMVPEPFLDRGEVAVDYLRFSRHLLPEAFKILGRLDDPVHSQGATGVLLLKRGDPMVEYQEQSGDVNLLIHPA